MSARAKLARLVLEQLARGNPVPEHDAFQLRNWAIDPEDAVLPLGEIPYSERRKRRIPFG
jgi:hypothetical protein